MKQPFAIRILAWFAGLASAGMYLSILLVFYEVAAPRMGGELVTRTEWLRMAAPLVAMIGILMALSSYALASQRSWARRPVMLIPILIIAYAIITRVLGWISPIIMSRALVNATILGALSAWYFYFKPNVAGYFRSLANGRT